jgi:hypothetical protein
MEAITINRYVQVICPVCKAQNTVRIPKSVINQASQLTTVSVPKGEICQHHFQVFIDKNFKIRGYQKVDFQLDSENDKKKKNLRHNYKENYVNSLKLYKSSVSKDNSIKNMPKKPDNKKETIIIEESFYKKNHRTLQDIYEEFWEFISDNNEIFQKFIVKDKKRRALFRMNELTQDSDRNLLQTIDKTIQ